MCNVMSVLLSDCPPCPFSPFFLALAELQQANLITSEECQKLDYIRARYPLPVRFLMQYAIRDVVTIQRGKSPEVVFQTADILRRHGFEKESKLLAGRQSSPSSVCLCYVVVQYPFDVEYSSLVWVCGEYQRWS